MLRLIRHLGIVLILSGLLALAAALIAWIHDGGILYLCFLAVSLPALLIGFLVMSCPDVSPGATIGSATATALLAWIVFSFLSGIPFWVAGRAGLIEPGFNQFINCLFEGTSAATSTGLTVVDDTAALPASFQFWRSICQWVGGLGVLVLAIAVVEWGKGGSLIYHAAARSKTIDDDIRRTTRAVWKVHAILTVFFFILFGILGMPWWESFNHALTTTGTGGFTMNGPGIGHYGKALQIAICFGMVAGAISFVSHYRVLFMRKLSCWLQTTEHRLFYALLVLGSLIAIFPAQPSQGFDRLFLWISALTTTGFSTASPLSVGLPFLCLLMAGMFVGAMAGSTAGGIKISRFSDLSRLLFHLAARRDLQWGNRERLALTITISWLATAAIGTWALDVSIDNREHTLTDCLFETLSAMGCVGLTSGLTSAELASTPKFILCLLMWLGRIELISFFLCGVLLASGNTEDDDSDAGGEPEE